MTYTNGTNGYHHPENEDIQTVPANLEAERAVLGACLFDPSAAERLATLLSPGDFYRERHQWIAQAVINLVRTGASVDLITTGDELERAGRLDGVGGLAYLADLMNGTPTSLYMPHYAQIVQRTATNRNHIAYAQALAELAFKDLPEDLLTAQRRELEKKYLAPKSLRSGDLVTLPQSLEDTYDLIGGYSQRANKKEPAFWPWPSFQNAIGEPFRGVIQQVVGDDGTGKTALLECVADYLTGERGYKGAFIIMDMTKEMMELRRTSRHTGITLDRLRAGNPTDEEIHCINAATEKLSAWGDNVDYIYAHGYNVDQVVQTIEYLRTSRGVDYIIIDNMRNLADTASPRQMMMRMNDNRIISDNITQIAAAIGKKGPEGAPDENGVWCFVINQLRKSGKEILSPSMMSKNDVEGSANQTNVVRYQYNLWRGDAKQDEWADGPNGRPVRIAKQGERSRFLHVKATKVTAGREFSCRLLTELEYSRMSEPSAFEDEDLDGDE
jgi:replicative DNA helicase